MLDGIEEIHDGLAALAAVDLGQCPGDELGAAVEELERLRAQFCAQRARVLAAFNLSGEWALDGSRTAAAWVARRSNTKIDAARGDVRLARHLRNMAATAAALGAGDIGEAHARRLARLASSPRDHVRQRFAEHEDQLVGYARDMSWDDFHRAVTYWEQAADPDGAEDKAKDDHQARRVHLSQTFRDTWRLDGQLDPLAGTELAVALERIYQELDEADWADARAEHGPLATVDHLPRTPAQRRADALVEMARRAMAAPVGARLPEPLITVLVGYETLHGPIRELLNNGTVVTPGQIAGMLSHADVERIVYAPGGRSIVDVSQRARFFRGGLRRTVEVRDRRCTYPGCSQPAERCDVDHVVPWAQGGLTTQDNGRLRCPPHNRHRGPGDADGNPTRPRPLLDPDDVGAPNAAPALDASAAAVAGGNAGAAGTTVPAVAGRSAEAHSASVKAAVAGSPETDGAGVGGSVAGAPTADGGGIADMTAPTGGDEADGVGVHMVRGTNFGRSEEEALCRRNGSTR
jgi:uncharacterized protein DUF222/HNH endonuclease